MTPISGAAWGKLFVYAIAMAPTVLFPLNIIPVLCILFGLFMTQRTHDFGHITAAARNVYIYCGLGFLISLAVFVYMLIDVASGSYLTYTDDEVLTPGILVIVFLLYASATRQLFLSPLAAHRAWIEANGLRAHRAAPPGPGPAKAVRVFGASRLKPYSVADELAKWSKLHEDGHIDAEEFRKVKQRLMDQD